MLPYALIQSHLNMVLVASSPLLFIIERSPGPEANRSAEKNGWN